MKYIFRQNHTDIFSSQFFNLLLSTCRGHAEVVVDGTFGEGAGLILLDDVHCDGWETSLLDCPHGIWGRTDCSHTEDVGVRCRGRSSPETNEVPVIAPSTGQDTPIYYSVGLTIRPSRYHLLTVRKKANH